MIGRNIALLCDGTGNSAASLAKTNVWRLYRALDLTSAGPDGKPLQVARYSDGVGTSSFKPLALLGGIFGVGLSRNVVDMYKFFCRNYEPGDRIYVFGFSRGAFTARILADLIYDQGVIRAASDEELELLAADAWRNYRRQYKLPLWDDDRDYTSKDRHKNVGLVDRIRNVRDWFIRLQRRGKPRYDVTKNKKVDEIKFIGVWDTVSAYGLPLDELTRGIDDWVWPMSMTNYRLSNKVRIARHALALDEERDSFHPLLWEEPREGRKASTDILQVWFPGVHSNIGGGYPDDTLSYVPLEWMQQEAAKAGLLFSSAGSCETYPPANPLGRLYDSRAGVAGYYRYQPRKLRALLHDPPVDTALLQDPKLKGKGFLGRVVVHHSVIDRIREGTDHYAPFGLPRDFCVLNPDGSISPWEPARGTGVDRDHRQEWVWNDVWRRRVGYFATVFVSLILAALPWLESWLPGGECTGPQCLLSPLVKGAGAFLPGFAERWVNTFAFHPGTTLVLALAITALMARSATLKRRIWDGSRRLWFDVMGLTPPNPASRPGLPDDWIFRLRSSPRYQRMMQIAKWKVASGIFGILVLLLFTAIGGVALIRMGTAASVTLGGVCHDDASRDGSWAIFTRKSCNKTPAQVSAGQTYKLRLTIGQPWRDCGIPATPNGNVASEEPFYMPLAAPLRRHLWQPWFALMVKVGHLGNETYQLDWRRLGQDEGDAKGSRIGEIWEAVLKPHGSGRLFLYVNDAPFAYRNNSGTALLQVDGMPALGLPPPEAAIPEECRSR